MLYRRAAQLIAQNRIAAVTVNTIAVERMAHFREMDVDLVMASGGGSTFTRVARFPTLTVSHLVRASRIRGQPVPHFSKPGWASLTTR